MRKLTLAIGFLFLLSISQVEKRTVKLEMLVRVIGSPDKFYTYVLKTAVRDDVYVPSSGGAVSVSQQEYQTKGPK